jgi:hypothetical protein
MPDATIADAQLIVQLLAVAVAGGADRGSEILFAYPTPPTLAQLRADHPRLGEEYQQVTGFLSQCETIGTFVKQGLLNEGLVNDLYWVSGAWKVSEQICRDMREESGEPRIFENFEWLASRAS